MSGQHIINITGCVSIQKLRNEAIQIAKEIGYPQWTIEALQRAENQTQINNVLIQARHEWDVKPGRIYIDRKKDATIETNDIPVLCIPAILNRQYDEHYAPVIDELEIG